MVLITGGFWYIRNIIVIGNPLPNAIDLGVIRLPGPPDLSPATSVATFLLNGPIGGSTSYLGFASRSVLVGGPSLA